jgi:F-type H+-transporting ATPase subunit delta
MASTNRVGVASQYARALLELANERQQAPAIAEEMRGIKEVVDGNPSLAAFLRDPGISENERDAMLQRVFANRVSLLVYNTMRVMNSKGRLGALGQVAEQYQELLDEQMGKIEVDATVARRLDPETMEFVRQRVSSALKKDAIVHQYVDESIIGGLVLRIEDKLIDGSVRAQLERMKRKLMQAVPQQS